LKPVLKVLVDEKALDYINLNQVAIISSTKQKKKDEKETYADCRRATKREFFFTKLVYIITVYPLFFELNQEQQKVILWHELLHIGKEFDGSVREHDVEEFFEIIPYRFKKELGEYF